MDGTVPDGVSPLHSDVVIDNQDMLLWVKKTQDNKIHGATRIEEAAYDAAGDENVDYAHNPVRKVLQDCGEDPRIPNQQQQRQHEMKQKGDENGRVEHLDQGNVDQGMEQEPLVAEEQTDEKTVRITINYEESDEKTAARERTEQEHPTKGIGQVAEENAGKDGVDKETTANDKERENASLEENSNDKPNNRTDVIEAVVPERKTGSERGRKENEEDDVVEIIEPKGSSRNQMRMRRCRSSLSNWSGDMEYQYVDSNAGYRRPRKRRARTREEEREHLDLIKLTSVFLQDVKGWKAVPGNGIIDWFYIKPGTEMAGFSSTKHPVGRQYHDFTESEEDMLEVLERNEVLKLEFEQFRSETEFQKRKEEEEKRRAEEEALRNRIEEEKRRQWEEKQRLRKEAARLERRKYLDMEKTKNVALKHRIKEALMEARERRRLAKEAAKREKELEKLARAEAKRQKQEMKRKSSEEKKAKRQKRSKKEYNGDFFLEPDANGSFNYLLYADIASDYEAFPIRERTLPERRSKIVTQKTVSMEESSSEDERFEHVEDDWVDSEEEGYKYPNPIITFNTPPRANSSSSSVGATSGGNGSNSQSAIMIGDSTQGTSTSSSSSRSNQDVVVRDDDEDAKLQDGKTKQKKATKRTKKGQSASKKANQNKSSSSVTPIEIDDKPNVSLYGRRRRMTKREERERLDEIKIASIFMQTVKGWIPYPGGILCNFFYCKPGVTFSKKFGSKRPDGVHLVDYAIDEGELVTVIQNHPELHQEFEEYKRENPYRKSELEYQG